MVIFLPDVRSCVPTRAEWDELNSKYKRQLKSVLSGDSVAADSSGAGNPAEDNGNDVSSEAQENADAPPDTEQKINNSETINDNLQSANEEPEEKIDEDQSTDHRNAEANEKALLIQIFISLYLPFFFSPYTPSLYKFQ